MQSDQHVLVLAARDNAPNPYPRDSWTPENWYKELNKLPFVHEEDHDILKRKLRLMRGWRYNLIPFMLLGFILMVLVIVELVRFRRSRGRKSEQHFGQPYGAAVSKQESAHLVA